MNLALGGLLLDLAAIDELNAKYKGRFRMFKGIEANIRSDGTVDMAPGELRLFEFVIAHARLAAIPQNRIVNDWPEKRFLEWARGAWDR